jgi:ketosteroid isomerase-like protein
MALSSSSATPETGASAIVAAEQGFAAQVRSQGVRDGFLAWLAPTSVLFRPGPVNGKAAYEKQPAGWHGLLAWTPVRASISADGLLGWSTGPWTWRRDSTQQKPDAHGEYMTVWRRKANGPWKAVLDCGIGHTAPTRNAPSLSYSAPVEAHGLGSRPLAARKSLYEADAGFARLAAGAGMPDAIARYATDDVIVLREGAQRWSGRAVARDSVAAHESRARLVSNAQSIAESGDMGYTYGTFVTGADSLPDSAWYVHVWHRGPAASWKLACQVVMPVPKR